MIFDSEKLVDTLVQVLSSIFVTVGVSSVLPAAQGGAAGKSRKVSAAAKERASMAEAKRKKRARRFIHRPYASSGGIRKCSLATSISRWSYHWIEPVHHHFCISTVGTCPAKSHLSRLSCGV